MQLIGINRFPHIIAIYQKDLSNKAQGQKQFPYDYTRTTFQKGASLIYPDLWIILNEFGIWEYLSRIFENFENVSRTSKIWKKRDIYSEVGGKI